MFDQNNGRPFTHVTSETIKKGFRIQDAELRVKNGGLLACQAAVLADVASTTGVPSDLVLHIKTVQELIDTIVDTFGKLPKVRAHLRLFCQDVAKRAAGFTDAPQPVYY